MKDNKKKVVQIITGVLLLIIFIFLLYINGVFNSYIENILNETPEAKVNEYLNAISQGDKASALNLWKISENQNYDVKKLNDLKERKEKNTQELMNNKMGNNFTIENIELWRTCCIPGIINDYKEAGGARLKIKLISENKAELHYTFDVFTRETTYLGDAAGYPVRNWVIRDIYAEGDSPLFWTMKAK